MIHVTQALSEVTRCRAVEPVGNTTETRISELPDTLAGVKIVLSVFLTEDERYETLRTWTERLFSRPWQPLVKTKWAIRQVPARKALILADGTMILHPEIYRTMLKGPHR